MSYRRAWLSDVEPLVRLLEANGIECFLDTEDIDPLADFSERIVRAIDSSYAMLVWWSSDYAASDFCMQELRRAFRHARRKSWDVGRRIWILNPENTAAHIIAGSLNTQNYLKPPGQGSESEWISPLSQRLESLKFEGPLGDELGSPEAPRLYGVPIPAREFVGRGAELMRIHSKLHPADLAAAGTTVALQTHGLGGVGKTALATAYANEFALDYSGGVIWLSFGSFSLGGRTRIRDAETAWLRAFDRALSDEPGLLRMLTRDHDDKPVPFAVVRERVANHFRGRPHLWVLDDVPALSPLDVRASVMTVLRAPTHDGRTLLTTRDGSPMDGFEHEHLSVLDEADAVRLLARFRPSRDEADVRAMHEIVEEVGAHPQALVLLGEHAREAPGGYPRVLERLRERGRLQRIEEIAAMLAPELGARARGIVATFAVSIEPLGEPAHEVLALVSAALANEPIPDDLLATCFGGPEREDIFNAAVRELLRASLLRRVDDATRVVRMHPLAAETAALLLQVGLPQTRSRLTEAIISRLEEAGDVRRHATLRYDVAHARFLAARVPDAAAVDLLIGISIFEFVRGDLAAAETSQAQALEIAQRVFGERHTKTGDAGLHLSITLAEQGYIKKARDIAESIFALRRSAGEDTPETTDAREVVAQIAGEFLESELACQLQEKVVEARRASLGAEHKRTLKSAGALSRMYLALARYGPARDLVTRLMEAVPRLFGETHPETMRTKQTYASLLAAEGDLEGAAKELDLVIESLQCVFGDRHPRVLRARNDLAGVLIESKQYDAARRISEGVLAEVDMAAGAPDLVGLAAMTHLATTTAASGRLAESHELAERVAQAFAAIVGDQHGGTLLAAGGVGAVLSLTTDLAGARRALEAAANGLIKAQGERDLRTLAVLEVLAQTMGRQGDLAQARALQEKIFANRTALLGEENELTVNAMFYLALTLVGAKDFAAARKLFERVHDFRQRKLGTEDPDTLVAALALGTSLVGLDDPDARSHLEGVLERARRVPGEADHLILQATALLARSLEDHAELRAAVEMRRAAVVLAGKVHGNEHEQTIEAMHALAATLRRSGDIPGALNLARQVHDMRRRTLGVSHPDTLSTAKEMAHILGKLEDRDSLVTHLESTLEAMRVAYGENHSERLLIMNALVTTRIGRGEVTVLREMAEAAVVMCRQLELDERHQLRLWSTNNLAAVLFASGECTDAVALQQQVVRSAREQLGDTHPMTITAAAVLAQMGWALGDRANAVAWMEAAAAWAETAYGKDDPNTRDANALLAQMRQELGAPPYPKA